MSMFKRFRLRDDRGSLPLAMMLTLVGTSLSTLMVPVVITQLRDTAAVVDRAQALHAAQAGIDIVMGRIRGSLGDIANLVCIPELTPLRGVIGTVAAGVTDMLPSRYQVSVEYQDPVNKTIPCVPAQSGVLTVQKAPAYAVITSLGTDKPGAATDDIKAGDRRTRKLSATYVFRFTNENIEGGLLRLYGGAYCLDAGSGSPATGTIVTTQPCNTGSSRQTFAYTKDLTLRLVSSMTAKNPLGMCIDSGADPVAGGLLMFQTCGVSPVIPYYQRWSLNDSSNFQNTANNGTSLGSLCMHAKAGATKGAFMELTTCGGASDNTRTFAPDATVGAGAADAPNQLVNFQQFGRCVDVTNFDVTIGFLIVWPCKQAPVITSVGWNQRFVVPLAPDEKGTVSGRITTYDNKNNKTYCLTTFKPGAPHFVTMKACPALLAAEDDKKAVEWKVSYKEGTYGTSYIIVDAYGQCLSPTDLDDAKLPPADIFKGSTVVSKLTTAPCDGGKLQKWNAPANIAKPTPLKNVGEK
ncbi:RICIN domain-containing protein [Dactylosporangium sp. NPDC049742]|uniref:RICIN domain-containing protein n=1 Tax=Dactylosporangium sp. NPDC049742 TaxID=3154737 RepID=UPI00343201F6